MDQVADPTHRKFNGFSDLFIMWIIAGRASSLDIMCLHNCITHLLNLRSSQLTERSCSVFSETHSFVSDSLIFLNHPCRGHTPTLVLFR